MGMHTRAFVITGVDRSNYSASCARVQASFLRGMHSSEECLVSFHLAFLTHVG